MVLRLLGSDEEAHPRALCWLHGFGRSRGPAAAELDDFLEKVAHVPSSTVVAHLATSMAEAAVRWPGSMYWYMSAMPRALGALAIGELNPHLSLGLPISEGSLCPFDSGCRG